MKWVLMKQRLKAQVPDFRSCSGSKRGLDGERPPAFDRKLASAYAV